MPTFFIETLGCQMNKLDSELLAEWLRRGGYEPVGEPQDADLAVLNTCSVRRHAEEKAFSRIGHWNHLRERTGRPRLIALVGCFAQRDPEAIRRRAPFVDVLCGPGRLPELAELARSAQAGDPAVAVDDFAADRRDFREPRDDLEAFDAGRSAPTGPGQAFVRVQRGCDKFCSYCVVPFVRGPECSRPVANILAEVVRLDRAGCREVTLLGQTVNSYRAEHEGRSIGLGGLLRLIHERTAIPRLRFVTSYPADFDPDILDAMAELERVCPYLHVPAQHGSNPILARMNRKYTVEDYLRLVERARRTVPGLSLAGDFITGFPGETEADHAASLWLLGEVRYKNCFVFRYSPRPGTAAARRFPDDVPSAVKTARLQALLDRQGTIAAEDNQASVGSTVNVLVEGRSKQARSGRRARQLVGRTTDDRIAVFDGPESVIGQIVRVRVESASSLTLFGTMDV